MQVHIAVYKNSGVNKIDSWDIRGNMVNPFDYSYIYQVVRNGPSHGFCAFNGRINAKTVWSVSR